ncbi:hypothetical protein F4680DRAFT_448442 [Xylaria scruposa]|nr:hypothetical protein F4680DRAFT_448442 [Xylaria scruposa]
MNCDSDIYVTSHDDIRNGRLSMCTDYGGTIHIRNATGTLKFTGQAHPFNISVTDCPGLQVLEFSDTFVVYNLYISEANELTTVSLPSLSTGTIEFDSSGGDDLGSPGSPPSLAIVGAKSLETFDTGNLTYVWDLVWLDVGQLEGRSLESFHSANITGANSIETNCCLDLEGLEEVLDLDVSAASGCSFTLSSMKSMGDLTLTNLGDLYPLGSLFNVPDYYSSPQPHLPSFAINGSLSLDSSLMPAGGDSEYPDGIVPRVTTVGSDFNITSNTNINLTFGALTSVGAGLYIYNNTNSGFKFDKVSTVGNMLLADNVNTTLPWFPALTRANDIHMRGYIDTSVGPNIFPALQSVTGAVVVEASNDDFDCSKLVQYHNEHIIHTLSCNGTNNGTNNGTDSSSSEPNQALSEGAWGGIGVAIGVVVIGLVGGLIWLYVHFKRQLRSLAKTTQQMPSIKDTTQGHVATPRTILAEEVDGAGIIRGKLDDPVELPVRPAEFSASP